MQFREFISLRYKPTLNLSQREYIFLKGQVSLQVSSFINFAKKYYVSYRCQPPGFPPGAPGKFAILRPPGGRRNPPGSSLYHPEILTTTPSHTGNGLLRVYSSSQSPCKRPGYGCGPRDTVKCLHKAYLCPLFPPVSP